MSFRSTTYPGLEHTIAYDHHVDHLTAQLKRMLHPAEYAAALQRVDVRIAKSSMSRIQALTHEVSQATTAW